MSAVSSRDNLYKRAYRWRLYGLSDQICLDPDALMALAFSRTATADAALRTFTLLGDAADRQPLADPPGDSGPGALGIDAAYARFSE